MKILFEFAIAVAVSGLPLALLGLAITRSYDKALVFAAGAFPIPFVAIQIAETGLGFRLGKAWILAGLLAAAACGAFAYLRRALLPRLERAAVGRLGLGVAFGSLYWCAAFWPNVSAGRVYSDLLWNVANAARFLVGVDIGDPHWYTPNPLKYHLLFHRAIAGLGLVSGDDVFFIASRTLPLMTSISMFVVAFSRLLNPRFSWAGIAFLAVLVARFNSTWMPENSFFQHMTGYAASTFFWSLPLTLLSLVFWMRWQRLRRIWVLRGASRGRGLALGFLAGFALAASLAYAKASSPFPFLFLEFAAGMALLGEIARKRVLLRSIPAISTFLAAPLGILAATILFLSPNEARLVPVLEARDYLDLGGYVLLVPFAAAGVASIFFWLTGGFKKPLVAMSMIAAMLNLCVFLLTSHPGRSDVFFVFNAVLLTSVAVAMAIRRETVVRLFGAFVGMLLAAHFLGSAGFSADSLGAFLRTANNPAEVPTDTQECKDLRSLGKSVADRGLVVVPYRLEDTFVVSAFLQARLWDESFRFTPYAKTEVNRAAKDYSSLEDPAARIEAARAFAFDERGIQERSPYAAAAESWDFLLVRSSDLPRLRQPLRELPVRRTGTWSLVALNKAGS